MRSVGFIFFVVLQLLVASNALSQPGEILESGDQVLDPNSDGFISLTNAGFSTDNYDVDEFEIKMFGIPIFGDGESLNDVQSGPDCGVTDLALDTAGYALYAGFDANENLIFRFRLAGDKKSVQSYSVLIDTDELVGADDPNSSSENPGFEIAITLIQKFGVYVYDIDGIQTCPTALQSYSINTNQQKATSSLESCGDTDIYIDFYVPFSDLTALFGITPDSNLRFVGVTNVSATCALQGSISDIGGVDDRDYNGCFSCAVLDLTVNQCPSSISNLCDTCGGFPLGFTETPVISLPVLANEVSINGVAEAGSEIYIEVYSGAGVLLDRDTTTTALDSTWQSNDFTGPLINGDSIVVGAFVPGKCVSNFAGSGLSFVIVSANQTPQLTASSQSVSYVEQDPPVIMSNDITITDDDSNITSAQVSIIGNFEIGFDVLEASPPPGIIASFSGATGVLSFTGIATLAEYDSALRSVTFHSIAAPPSVDIRTVSFEVNDGTNGSQPLNISILVSVLNEPPLISGTLTALNYTEGDGPVLLDDAIIITDADDINIVAASVIFTGVYHPGEDTLVFVDQNGIQGIFGEGVLSILGVASITDYRAALRSITYENLSITPDTLQRNLQFIVSDEDVSSLPFDRKINIASVIEGPEITTFGGAVTYSKTYTEGDGQIYLIADLSVSDADDINLEGATLSISNNYILDEDILSASAPPGISSAFDSVNGILTLQGTATLADYKDALETVTYENTSENPSSLPRTIIIDVTDGEVNSNTIEGTLNVIPVNDAPVIIGDSLSLVYAESSGPIIIDDLIEVLDVDDVELVSATVTFISHYQMMEDLLAFNDQSGITAVFDQTTGILTLSGSASLTDYQIALRSITYENPKDRATLSVRTVEFIINDGDQLSNAFLKEIIIEEVEDPVIVYQLVTPDGDSQNDTWIIEGIEQFPNNTVSLFNRWNSLVYQQESYDNALTGWAGDANKGFSKGELPDGTYFYTIGLGDGSDLLEGFIVLKRK